MTSKELIIMNLLGSLNSENYVNLATRVSENLTNEELMILAVDFLFEKIAEQPHSCKLCALFAKSIIQSEQQKEGRAMPFFRKRLVSVAQTKFEECTKAEEGQLINIRFIGELFKVDIMTSKILIVIATSILFKDSSTGSVESLSRELEIVCKLLSTVGKKILEKVEPLSEYCARMKELAANPELEERIKDILNDTIRLVEPLPPVVESQAETKSDQLAAVKKRYHVTITDNIEDQPCTDQKQRISPSALGEYANLACDRYLHNIRNRTQPDESSEERSIAAEEGRVFETKIVEQLPEDVFRDIEFDSATHFINYVTNEMLERKNAPFYLHEAILVTANTDNWLSDIVTKCRPDLIRVSVNTESEKIELTAIEIKSSNSIKIKAVGQASVYAMVLSEWIFGNENFESEVSTGVLHRGLTAPKIVDSAIVSNNLRLFLKNPEAFLSTSNNWKLNYKCSECYFTETCRTETKGTLRSLDINLTDMEDLSIQTGIDVADKEGVEKLQNLHRHLANRYRKETGFKVLSDNSYGTNNETISNRVSVDPETTEKLYQSLFVDNVLRSDIFSRSLHKLMTKPASDSNKPTAKIDIEIRLSDDERVSGHISVSTEEDAAPTEMDFDSDRDSVGRQLDSLTNDYNNVVTRLCVKDDRTDKDVKEKKDKKEKQETKEKKVKKNKKKKPEPEPEPDYSNIELIDAGGVDVVHVGFQKLFSSIDSPSDPLGKLLVSETEKCENSQRPIHLCNCKTADVTIEVNLTSEPEGVNGYLRVKTSNKSASDNTKLPNNKQQAADQIRTVLSELRQSYNTNIVCLEVGYPNEGKVRIKSKEGIHKVIDLYRSLFAGKTTHMNTFDNLSNLFFNKLSEAKIEAAKTGLPHRKILSTTVKLSKDPADVELYVSVFYDSLKPEVTAGHMLVVADRTDRKFTDIDYVPEELCSNYNLDLGTGTAVAKKLSLVFKAMRAGQTFTIFTPTYRDASDLKKLISDTKIPDLGWLVGAYPTDTLGGVELYSQSMSVRDDYSPARSINRTTLNWIQLLESVVTATNNKTGENIECPKFSTDGTFIPVEKIYSICDALVPILNRFLRACGKDVVTFNETSTAERRVAVISRIIPSVQSTINCYLPEESQLSRVQLLPVDLSESPALDKRGFKVRQATVWDLLASRLGAPIPNVRDGMSVVEYCTKVADSIAAHVGVADQETGNRSIFDIIKKWCHSKTQAIYTRPPLIIPIPAILKGLFAPPFPDMNFEEEIIFKEIFPEEEPFTVVKRLVDEDRSQAIIRNTRTAYKAIFRLRGCFDKELAGSYHIHPISKISGIEGTNARLYQNTMDVQLAECRRNNQGVLFFRVSECGKTAKLIHGTGKISQTFNYSDWMTYVAELMPEPSVSCYSRYSFCDLKYMSDNCSMDSWDLKEGQAIASVFRNKRISDYDKMIHVLLQIETDVGAIGDSPVVGFHKTSPFDWIRPGVVFSLRKRLRSSTCADCCSAWMSVTGRECWESLFDGPTRFNTTSPFLDVSDYQIRKTRTGQISSKNQLIKHQKDAVELALRNRHSVIVGMPGSGKTYVTRCISAMLIQHAIYAKKNKLFTIAVTGANSGTVQRLIDDISRELGGEVFCATLKGREWIPAAGMIESGKNPSSKFHRILGIPFDRLSKFTKYYTLSSTYRSHACCKRFDENLDVPMWFQAAIVDEASQLPAYKMSLLLKRLTDHGRIIVVGDPMQRQPENLTSEAGAEEGDVVVCNSLLLACLKKADGTPVDSRECVAEPLLSSVITKLPTCIRSHSKVSSLFQTFYGQQKSGSITEDSQKTLYKRKNAIKNTTDQHHPIWKLFSEHETLAGGLCVELPNPIVCGVDGLKGYPNVEDTLCDQQTDTALREYYLKVQEQCVVDIVWCIQSMFEKITTRKGKDADTPLSFWILVKQRGSRELEERIKKLVPDVDISFGTSDQAQGQERDVVIIPREIPSKYGGVMGKWQFDLTTLNVSFSRACSLVVVVTPSDAVPSVSLSLDEDVQLGYRYLRQFQKNAITTMKPCATTSFMRPA